MFRRQVVLGAILLIAGGAGCTTSPQRSSEPTPTPTQTPEPDENGSDDGADSTPDVEAIESRVLECETSSIRDAYATSAAETFADPIDPQIVDTDIRSDGVVVETKTVFGTIRSGGDDAPDEHVDYEVIAVYFVTEDATYRSSDPAVDPRETTPIDC
ncbi:MAG: hypothetical protein ACQETB_12240 [Halobacteriota archaeon]